MLITEIYRVCDYVIKFFQYRGKWDGSVDKMLTPSRGEEQGTDPYNPNKIWALGLVTICNPTKSQGLTGAS